MARKLRIGDTVKLTGQFLRNTGQACGDEGHKRWRVVACECRLCARGLIVATDEAGYDDPTRPRHIAVANLYRVGTLDSRNA